jgi:hypothetical protein
MANPQPKRRTIFHGSRMASSHTRSLPPLPEGIRKSRTAPKTAMFASETIGRYSSQRDRVIHSEAVRRKTERTLRSCELKGPSIRTSVSILTGSPCPFWGIATNTR